MVRRTTKNILLIGQARARWENQKWDQEPEQQSKYKGLVMSGINEHRAYTSHSEGAMRVLMYVHDWVQVSAIAISSQMLVNMSVMAVFVGCALLWESEFNADSSVDMTSQNPFNRDPQFVYENTNCQYINTNCPYIDPVKCVLCLVLCDRLQLSCNPV